MDKENTVDKDLLVDLLNYLIKDRRDLSWKIEPALITSKGPTMFHLIIFEIKTNNTIVWITFDDKSGEVLRFKTDGISEEMKAENLIDALLDLIFLKKEGNFEFQN